ncbi:hypothetical protein C8R44DRAFT_772148 [Mycena epipterygia]|nr:hypothetical protein C8R44DRAFT_772148 [Mycena epipterygia]
MQFFPSVLALMLSTAALASASAVDARQAAQTTISTHLGVLLTLDIAVGSVQDNNDTVIVKDQKGNTMLTVTKS